MLLNKTKWKAHLYSVVYTSGNNCFQSNLKLSHTRKIIFPRSYSCLSYQFYLHTSMWKSKTFSGFEWCGGWNNAVAGNWTTWFLDFNKRGARNKRGDPKFGPFLINVEPDITKLWVENSQKINFRGTTSIREGRVLLQRYLLFLLFLKSRMQIFLKNFLFRTM